MTNLTLQWPMVPPLHEQPTAGANFCIESSSTLLLEVETFEEDDARCVEVGTPHVSRPSRRFLSGAVLSALALCGVTYVGLRFSGQHIANVPVTQADEIVQKVTANHAFRQCGPVSNDVDFIYTSGKGFDHSPGPDDCCARCRDTPTCKSWTWVKDMGEPCGSQCWVKMGDLKHNISKKGIVSGHHPRAAAISMLAPVSHSDHWCRPPANAKMPVIWDYGAAGEVVDVKVMTYNLNWFTIWKGWSQGRPITIKHTSQPEPYDLLGFQECGDPDWVMANAGLKDQYNIFKGTHQVCMAVRKANWAVLAHGIEDVAEDSRLQYFGVRIAMWARLRHVPSGRTFFFMNHHGPTPVDSGGLCGGAATAYNLLNVVKKFAQDGDAIILVGDFNADPTSLTIQFLGHGLRTTAFNGNGAHGGIDNMFTNLPPSSITSATVLNTGGSDHNALAAIFHVR